MSYHGGSSARTSSTNRTTSSNRRVANIRAAVTPPVAPPGYHYMPDGSLMLDSQMQAQEIQTQAPAIQNPSPSAPGRTKTAPSQKNRIKLGGTRLLATGAELISGNNVIDSKAKIVLPTPPPKGYHYMTDGSLMSDADHAIIYSRNNVFLDLNLSTISEAGESRNFTVTGDAGTSFSLEIINEDGKYYNFNCKEFQTTKYRLSKPINSNGYKNKIVFPAVADADQYDIYFWADGGSSHGGYVEKRFGDGTLDINSSSGSNSLLLQKVIYQNMDLTLTVSVNSPNSTIEAGTLVESTFDLSTGSGIGRTAFKAACSVTTAAKCYTIKKQPTTSDLISYSPVVIGSPIDIPGENIYPTATAAFTGDDVNGAITSGAVVEIDADVAGNVVIGDKITTPVTTDTVNGARDASAVAVTMDAAVATKMAVGDRVTGNAALDAGEFTVAAIASTNVFNLSSAVAIADGATLTFSSKINRSLTTVSSLDPAEEDKQFTMSQDIQFRDNAPLTFFNQMNHKWSVSNVLGLKIGQAPLSATNITAGSVLNNYKDSEIVFACTDMEREIITAQLPSIEAVGKSTVTRATGALVQPGNIIFDRQQALALSGDSISIGGYGIKNIKDLYGYNVKLSDLKIELTKVTTTTTSAVENSTSVPVASRNGILDDVSVVSGVGINPAVVNPTVDTGAGAVVGAGTLVLTSAQTLEQGATLTFSEAGQTATITGNIEILKAGNADANIRIDIEKLLSIT